MTGNKACLSFVLSFAGSKIGSTKKEGYQIKSQLDISTSSSFYNVILYWDIQPPSHQHDCDQFIDMGI